MGLLVQADEQCPKEDAHRCLAQLHSLAPTQQYGSILYNLISWLHANHSRQQVKIRHEVFYRAGASDIEPSAMSYMLISVLARAFLCARR